MRGGRPGEDGMRRGVGGGERVAEVWGRDLADSEQTEPRQPLFTRPCLWAHWLLRRRIVVVRGEVMGC